MVGSPPPWRAAMMIARLSLLHSLPRLASMAPFLCLIVAQWEWPDMASPSRRTCRTEPFERSGPGDARQSIDVDSVVLRVPLSFRETSTLWSRSRSFSFMSSTCFVWLPADAGLVQLQRLLPRLAGRLLVAWRK